MLESVPNMAFAIGYTNASWTLKVDLVSLLRRPHAALHAASTSWRSSRRAAGGTDGHAAVHRA